MTSWIQTRSWPSSGNNSDTFANACTLVFIGALALQASCRPAAQHVFDDRVRAYHREEIGIRTFDRIRRIMPYSRQSSPNLHARGAFDVMLDLTLCAGRGARRFLVSVFSEIEPFGGLALLGSRERTPYARVTSVICVTCVHKSCSRLARF